MMPAPILKLRIKRRGGLKLLSIPSVNSIQVANLEADFLRRAREAKADGNRQAAAAYSNAASLLIEASNRRGPKRVKLGLRLTR